ncbi:MAG: hypothetical protein ACI8XB_001407 [Patiriisocius sp.]|jgi:hypothetical protein
MTVKITSIFIALVLFSGCKVHESAVSVDKKKIKWIESLTVDEESYQVLVTVPRSSSIAESANQAERQGRLKMASEIYKVSDAQFGELLEEIIKEDLRKEVVSRSQQNEIVKEIINMKTFSTYKSTNDYSVCYRMDKKEYERLRNETKKSSLQLAVAHLDSARIYRSLRNPMKAAIEYSKALVTIQGYLYSPVDYEGEDLIKNLDKVIFDEMLALRNEMSIDCDPNKEVLLNHANNYVGILSFEVLQGNEKTGNVNISIDVAGVRNENILVNGYSVLVANLPAKLSNPYVTLRIDLFEHLLTQGNNVCAMLYQKIQLINERVKINRVYPKFNVIKNSDSIWDQKAFEMFKAGIASSAMNFEENWSESIINITPVIKYTEEEKSGHVKITGQWIMNFGDGIERYVGRKIVLTKTSKDLALRELGSRLNSFLTSDVLLDLTQILEKL